jgi:hypothetical protein
MDKINHGEGKVSKGNVLMSMLSTDAVVRKWLYIFLYISSPSPAHC